MTKTKTAPAADATPATFHYFASCGIGWATAETPAAAIKKLVTAYIDAKIIRDSLRHGGFYIWTVRVELPPDARYTINYYKPDKQPNGDAVPLSESQDWSVITARGTAVPTARGVENVNTYTA